MPQSEHDIDEFDEEYKSKTDLKREMHAMQDFALKLVKLSKHQRSKVPFSDGLLESLALADKIKNKPEALRRHVRYMAKVLTENDLEPIHKALDIMANKHQQDSIRHQQLEQLREDLLSQDNDFIESVLSDNDTMERQKLRQLIRNANKEKKAEKIAKGHQELLNYLKQHVAV
ncbi:ribosome biogenesis factor YjgA [Thalassotalea sp. G2M2-11]|uniref:ribosome biogenesis factor YjgA n=1 Tax=Thalassotalea sp. G2M2-11 TaxID=2787627 RepID=UPI0019CFC2A2|nr:ribosome biogenesis factor YjgA [Thalassotalea sp. G2M2-11]